MCFVSPRTLELVDTYLPVAIGASAKDLAALLRGDLQPGASADAAWTKLVLVGTAALATAALLAAIANLARRTLAERRHALAASGARSDLPSSHTTLL